MTVTDRTDATDAEFEARLERLDRLEVADESAVQRVARALWDTGIPTYREDVDDLARAALDALKPPPPDGGDVR